MPARLARLFLVAAVLATAAAPVGAQVDEPAATLELAERSAWVSESEAVTLDITTDGDTSGTTMRVRIHPPLADADSLEESLTDDVGGITLSVDLGPTEEIPAEASGARRITLTAEEIRSPGMHPVVVELRSADGQVLDTVRTPVLRLGTDDDPLAAPQLALFVDVATDPTVGPQGRRDLTSTEMDRLERLASFLEQLSGGVSSEAGDRAPATVLAVPDTLDALLASTDPAAGTVLDRVVEAAAADPVGQPYVPLSAAALEAAGLDDVLVATIRAGTAVLADRLGVVPDTSLWTDATVTPDAAPLLAWTGVETVMTGSTTAGDGDTGDGRLLVPAGPRPVPALTEPPLDALVVDEATSDALIEPLGARVDAVAVALADLVLRDDGRSSTVAVRIDDVPDDALLRTLVPLLTAPDAPVPLVDRPTAPSVRDPDDEDLPDPVTLPTGADDDLVPIADRYREVERSVATFDTFVGTETSRTVDLSVRLWTSVAVGLGVDERRDLLASVEDAVLAGFDGITLTGQTDLNLTSRRGELPVAIANTNDYPVRVMIRIRSDRLRFPDGEEFEVTAQPDITRLDIPVEALATGSVPTFVEIRTPDGQLLLDNRQLNVRSTAVTGVGLALSLGALAVLAVWWVRTWRKQRTTERGAALVQYALGLSLLAIAGIGAAQFLEDRTSDQVDNQADCISTRPPPTSCQTEPLVADGGNDQSSSGPGGGGGTPTSATAIIAPTVTSAVTPAGARFDVVVGVDLFEDPELTMPLDGVVMTAQITITQSALPSRVGQFTYVDCTTDGSGHCDFEFDSRFDDVDQVSFDVVAAGIDTAYDFGNFAPVTIDRP